MTQEKTIDGIEQVLYCLGKCPLASEPFMLVI